jgi:hypothetical protein
VRRPTSVSGREKYANAFANAHLNQVVATESRELGRTIHIVRRLNSIAESQTKQTGDLLIVKVVIAAVEIVVAGCAPSLVKAKKRRHALVGLIPPRRPEGRAG